MLITIITILIITILVTTYIYVNYKLAYWKRRNIPHAKPKLYLKSKGIFWELKLAYDEFKDVKPFFGSYLLFKPMIIATDLEFIKRISVKDFEYFHDRGFYYTDDDPCAQNILNFEGQKWKNLRTKISPAFSQPKMKLMLPTIVKVGWRLCQRLDELRVATGQMVEMKNLMAKFTMDVIGCCAFGIECNTLGDKNSEFYEIGADIFQFSTPRMLYVIFTWCFHDLSKVLGLRQNPKRYADFFTKIVKQTMRYREENNVKQNDFMQLLMELKDSENGLSLDEIVGQCFAFFAAGYETSSSTVTYCLYELAQNLEIQDKAREEVKKVMQKYNGELNYEALTDMTYLEQIVSETLRLHHPAPAALREATKDYYVPEYNMTIEKGVGVIIPLRELQRDERYFPNPEKFDPDRFSPEAVRQRDPMTYIPFGYGPRICIGMNFGKIESKIAIALLLNQFKFLNCSKTNIPLELNWKNPVTLGPLDVWLRVEKV